MAERTRTSWSAERLEENLAALDVAQPRLAERLRWPVDDGHVVLDPEPRYRIHRTLYPLEPAEDPALDLDQAGGECPVMVLGAGAGPWLGRLLERVSGRDVVVWDRDPWLLRLVLMRLDLGERLTSGRLRLALGTDLLDVRAEGHARVEHPLLARVYGREVAAHAGAEEHAAEGRRYTAICAGGLFVDQVADELARGGAVPWTLDVARLSAEEVDVALERLRPERVFAINYVGGLAEMCARHDTELVCWEIDPSTTRPRVAPEAAHAARICTWRRRNVEVFEAAGFERVEHLPLAADPVVRRPLVLDGAERDRFGAPIAFVGSSLVGSVRAFRARFAAQWCAWSGRAGAEGQAGAEAALAAVLAAQRADFSTFRVPELLEEAAPGLRAAVLADPGAEDPVALVGELAASEKRLTYVANLAPLGIAAWGDAGWEVIARHGVDHRGTAGHRHDLTRIYNATLVNLDVGRLYQPDIVTMRTFDVLACGAFALVEHNEELAELFDVGVELESYRDLGELREKAAHYLAHPDQARAIAARGRAAILERHTLAHRLRGCGA